MLEIFDRTSATGRRFAGLLLALALWPAAGLADEGGPTVKFKALLDARLAFTDDTRSWFDSGLGKNRYGGSGQDHRARTRIAEASLLIEPEFSWSLNGSIHIKHDNEQKNPLDVVEAVLRYRPLPIGNFRIRARVGAFFPPISLEHTGPGWSTTRTISGSAINTWVGEELRTIGGELGAARTWEDDTVSWVGAVFGANDAAGTLLNWRGWSLHDRKTGLNDRLALAPIPPVQAGGPFASQAPWVEPFHEIDGRVGYYTGIRWKHGDFSDVRLMHYDNRADPTAFDGEQYAWQTHFNSVAVRVQLPNDVELLSQYMQGSTKMGWLPAPQDTAAADVEFWGFYALLGKRFGKHQVALRLDLFDVDEVDPIAIDDNNEHGSAVTFAYGFKTAKHQKLMVELQQIKSERPERTALGLNDDADEFLIQINYRIVYP